MTPAAQSSVNDKVLKCALTSFPLRSLLSLQSSVTLSTSGSFGSRFPSFTLRGGDGVRWGRAENHRVTPDTTVSGWGAEKPPRGSEWRALSSYPFARWPQRPWSSRGPDERPVVDGAALRALGPDGGGVLGHLGRDHTSAELQDLLVSQTRTLQDRNQLKHVFTSLSIF